MAEVDEILFTDGLNGNDLLAAVVSTNRGLETARKRAKAARQRQPEDCHDTLDECCNKRGEDKQVNGKANDVRMARIVRR